MALSEPLQKIREAASAAVEEFDKVVRVRRDTQQRTKQVQQAVEQLIKSIERSRFESIDDFVSSLAQLREQRGHALGLKELRYVDESIVEAERSRRSIYIFVKRTLGVPLMDTFDAASADSSIAARTTTTIAPHGVPDVP